ncbi:hypothetical protein UPYG_G00332530 [Umbra pygmaea]|uniref:Nuclear transcription factor Y subunit gamma n=1 Tax=Umbra pygmaea TaxID=75934 RepID=A0ABD0VVM6_UMBPY
MDGLETTYDDAAQDFIDCVVCSKSIRGDTLYKIHLTTIQHIRKEDSLVALGRAVRDHDVPQFTDIKEYLQYLDIDEPIIGLNALEEVDPVAHDSQPGPRYFCKMCDHIASLPNMVNHIIGRKHRQKYLETKRPDLVTWDNLSSQSQSGKVIRAKAEVLERQDGQGSPKALKKSRNVGKSNISIVPPKQKGSQNHPMGVPPPPHPSYNRREGHRPPEGLKFLGRDYDLRGGRPDDDVSRPPFHKSNPYFLADSEREAYLREKDCNPHGFEDDRLARAGFREDDLRRQDFMEYDFRRSGRYHEEQQLSQEFLEDMRRREYLERGGPRPGHPEEVPHQAYPEDYPEGPSRSRIYPDNDPLGQFYSEEVLRRKTHNAKASMDRDFRQNEQPPERGYLHGRAFLDEVPLQQDFPDNTPHYFDEAQRKADHRQPFPDNSYAEVSRRGDYEEEEARRRAYPEEEPHMATYPEGNPHRRSLDREPSGYGSHGGLDRQACADQDLRFANQIEDQMKTGGQSSREHLLGRVNPMYQEGRSLKHSEAARVMGAPVMRGPSQRTAERVKTEIPEPFRRFLKGAIDDNKGPTTRKRKSRFSDATEHEQEVVAKKMLMDDNRRMMERSAKPQGPANLQMMTEANPETGDVLDVLNNIKVENVNEANFLKDKLSNLLMEFQAQKSQKTTVAPGFQTLGPAVISKDYNHISKEPLETPRHDYDRSYREVPEERHYEDQSPRNPQEHPQDRYTRDPPQDPYRGRPRDIDERTERRTQYEEVFGQGNMYPKSSARPAELHCEPVKQMSMSADSFGAGGSDAQQSLQSFWPRVMEEIRNLTVKDFRVQELPLARIKKIMKLDEDVKMISAEAPVLFAKAAQIFITELTLRAWIHTEDNKRRTLQRNDIAMAITKFDQFDFLIDIVPRDELKPPKRQEEVRQSVAPAEPVQYYFTLAQQPGQVQGQQQGQQATAQQATTLQPGQIIITQPQQGQVLQGGGASQQFRQVQLAQSQGTPITSAPVTMQVGDQQVQIVQASSQGQAQTVQSGGQTMQVMQQIITNTGEIQQIPVQLNTGQLQYIRLAQPISGTQVVQGQIQTLGNTQQVQITQTEQGQQQFNQFTDGQQLYQIQQVTMPAGQDLSQPMFIQSTSQTADGQVTAQVSAD